MTPPNVLGAPKPQSSVMISSTFGAPLGGTTRGGHHGFDSEAFSLITPPNFGSGGGSCLPLMVVVAPAEPNSPENCCAMHDEEENAKAAPEIVTAIVSFTVPIRRPLRFDTLLPTDIRRP